MLTATIPSSIRIDTEIDEVPPVLVEAVELDQLLVNLAINARDAVEGRGHIVIRLRRVELAPVECAACRVPVSGSWVELAVADDGAGIPPEVLPRIFEPFFSTKEVGKGSGMGLAVVYGIMEKVGGHILVETGVGTGTTVRLLFPLVARDTAPVAGDERLATLASVPGGGRHLLVVDDEPALAAMWQDLLEGHGYEVSAHTDGRSALTAFQSAPGVYAAIVSDMTMPGMNGLELAQAALALRPDLPFFLCSGYSDLIDAERAAALGIRRYFRKPVAAADLLAALAEEADRRAAG